MKNASTNTNWSSGLKKYNYGKKMRHDDADFLAT